MNFFILIIQFSFFISVNTNGKQNEKTKEAPKLTYPSQWQIPNIYYHINKTLNETPIREALDKIQKQTCLRFNLMNEDNFKNDIEGLEFVNQNKCATFLGNINKTKLHTIFIGGNCSGENDVGKIQQLVGKALGMIFQHNRPDRDDYINVNKTGINYDVYNKTIVDQYLKKWNSSIVHLYGIGYDYNSLLHVKSGVFRPLNDTTPTLNANISEYNKMMGQTVEFNFADYKLLNYHFCNKSYVTMHGEMPNCTNSGYYDINIEKNGTCKCPNGFTGQLCKNLTKSDESCERNQERNANSTEQTLSAKGKKNCTYRIKTSSNKHVLITALNVSTQTPHQGQKCMPENGFEIKHRNDKSPAGLCLCGNYSNITLTSEGNEVIVLYTGRNETDSFKLTYSEVSQNNK